MPHITTVSISDEHDEFLKQHKEYSATKILRNGINQIMEFKFNTNEQIEKLQKANETIQEYLTRSDCNLTDALDKIAILEGKLKDDKR